MELIAAKILVGFAVGILIGMSGIGGGVLLLPVLIYGLGVPPITAVGSDALFNFFTKIPAGLMHLKKGTVRRKVVLALAVGSVPGSIAGVCSPTSAHCTAMALTASSRRPWVFSSSSSLCC
jgi:uncharacterized membrane protein YfcA